MAKHKENKIAQVLSLVGLLWIASGHFLPIKININSSEIVINAFSEFYLIPAFAVWRFKRERNAFEKRRLKIMLGFFLLYWIIFPLLMNKTPIIDGSFVPLATAYHTIGAAAFFIFFIAVLIFGKRADCGWNCTCVFTRETVGFAFRDKTPKGGIWWHLRHLKIVMLIMVWAYLFILIIRPEIANNTLQKPMYRLILDLYYASILLIPFIGHRNICRFLCPWSATWALLNKIGPYKIVANQSKCIKCGICDKECDMGIPVQRYVLEKGIINSGECMGCERCVESCPKDVLEIQDYKQVFKSKSMSSQKRNIFIIIGLTILIIPFVFTNLIGLLVGLVGIVLTLIGLFGWSPK